VSVWSREGLAELPPSLPVLVILSGEPSPALRDRADVVTERFAVLPAGDLVEHLGG